jgi:hypothetical protein
MFDERLIAYRELQDAFHERLGPCLELGIRSNWYRSLPYAALDRLCIAIDGKPVPEAAMLVLCDGLATPVDELATMVTRFWFVPDVLRILIARTEKMAAGPHLVTVSYDMRITDLVIAGQAYIEPACAQALMVAP